MENRELGEVGREHRIRMKRTKVGGGGVEREEDAADGEAKTRAADGSPIACTGVTGEEGG